MKLRFGPLSLLVLFGVASATGQTFSEFPIPTPGTSPQGITAGPDGNVWFTEYQPFGNKIGRITPEGVITEFIIPSEFAHPLLITAGPDGSLWFTENRGPNAIARITTSGEITEFPVPGRDNNPWGITTGPDGALWFTEHWGNKIGRITTSGSITEFPLPACDRCDSFRSGPGGIVLGPDGALWFTEQYANKIGRITTSGAITEFPIPGPDSYPDCSRGGPCGPVGIAAGSDGALWFTEKAANKIGRITTSGEITEFPIPTPGSSDGGELFDIVAGLDGNLYFTERTGNKIGRITTAGEITEFPIPTLAFPQGIAIGPDGAIWFTEDANKIGRLSLGQLTCESDPTTLCLNASRFRVTADWRKPDGTTGQGQAVSLTPDSGYFWFFNPANIEAVVKVLNACSVNDHHWVFGAGLTNVEVTLRVVDTHTGSTKIYVNPLGTAFQPIQDTSAFETCP